MSDEEIINWLASSEADGLLTAIARRLARRLQLRPRLQSALGINLNTEAEGDIISILKSELYIFIRDKHAALRTQSPAAGVKPAAYLLASFENHCLDKTRKKDEAPYAYLYKRAGDVLRDSDIFHTVPIPQAGIAYSLEKENNTRIQPLPDEHLAAVAFPGARLAALTYAAVNRKEAMANCRVGNPGSSAGVRQV